MANIVTVSQLRTILGVSDSLYSDLYLQSIIESAQDVILPLLVANQAAVADVYLTNNVAYYVTQRPHGFVTGQSVIVSECVPSTFNGTVTVTNHIADPYIFSAAKTNADITLRAVIPAGVACLSGSDALTLYADNHAVENAILLVSVEIFQSIVAPGGQIEGVDFAPSPFRMGRSLLNRVVGLLSPYLDVSTMAM
jgi:hypothetical protein